MQRKTALGLSAAIVATALILAVQYWPSDATDHTTEVLQRPGSPPSASSEIDPPGGGGRTSTAELARQEVAPEKRFLLIKVCSTENDPIAGARISSNDQIGSPGSQTNAQGETSVSRVPSATTTYVVSARGYIPKSVSVSPEQASVQVHLEPARSLLVHVQDATFNPIQNVTCRVIDSKQALAPRSATETSSSQTGQTGDVSFNNLHARTYVVQIADRDWHPMRFENVSQDGTVSLREGDASLVVTLTRATVALVEVVGDEVICSYYRAHMAPTVAALGLIGKMTEIEKECRRLFPNAIVKAWIAPPNEKDNKEDEVELVMYTRFAGWSHLNVRTKEWFPGVQPEVISLSPGSVAQTATMLVTWTSGVTIPLVATLQNQDHGLITQLLDKPSHEVPLGEYSIALLSQGLRDYVKVSQRWVKATTPGLAVEIRVDSLCKVEEVKCHLASDEPDRPALTGMLEIVDAESRKVIYQLPVVEGTITMLLPTEKPLLWRFSESSGRTLSAETDASCMTTRMMTVVMKPNR